MPISTKPRVRTKHGTVPLSSGFVIVLSILLSFLFILSVCLAFVNSDAGAFFRDGLNEVAARNPGVRF